MEKILSKVLEDFGFNAGTVSCKAFGSGLINNTWKVVDGTEAYILQRINENVFQQPEVIAENITLTGNYLKEFHPGYFFVQPLKNSTGNIVTTITEGKFRMFPFVKNSHTIDVVTNAAQAYEAAKQFAKFTRTLEGINIDALQITLPDFHNLSLRYSQFEQALKNGNEKRIAQSQELAAQIFKYKDILTTFENIKQDTSFKLRVTHHDTKISNVLFDENDKGICVIDLDTVMPGYFISDVGDMMRTYLCPVSEEEKDLAKIEIRSDFYKAIVDGYLSEMGGELTEKEKQYFLYAGKFMIYMQAIRFLTDHLNNDIYYGSKYEGHNFVRAANQLTLLNQLMVFATDLHEL